MSEDKTIDREIEEFLAARLDYRYPTSATDTWIYSDSALKELRDEAVDLQKTLNGWGEYLEEEIERLDGYISNRDSENEDEETLE